MEASSRLLSLVPSSISSLSPTLRPNPNHRRTISPPRFILMAKQQESSSESSGFLEKAAIASGSVASPVIGWSLYVLYTTGCGLPPGPAGSIGALEGVSYLAVAGIVGWSVYSKVKTGTGLPGGPYGLLGAVEGLSFLTFLAVLVVFGAQFVQRGYIPGPLPGDSCF